MMERAVAWVSVTYKTKSLQGSVEERAVAWESVSHQTKKSWGSTKERAKQNMGKCCPTERKKQSKVLGFHRGKSQATDPWGSEDRATENRDRSMWGSKERATEAIEKSWGSMKERAKRNMGKCCPTERKHGKVLPYRAKEPQRNRAKFWGSIEERENRSMWGSKERATEEKKWGDVVPLQ